MLDFLFLVCWDDNKEVILNYTFLVNLVAVDNIFYYFFSFYHSSKSSVVYMGADSSKVFWVYLDWYPVSPRYWYLDIIRSTFKKVALCGLNPWAYPWVQSPKVFCFTSWRSWCCSWCPLHIIIMYFIWDVRSETASFGGTWATPIWAWSCRSLEYWYPDWWFRCRWFLITFSVFFLCIWLLISAIYST